LAKRKQQAVTPMVNQYKLPLYAAIAEFTEKKSRFISSISPVSSEEEALSFLGSIRGKHREATHNVYAYRIKNSGICRFSDDGEPFVTAGKPFLEAFIKQDIYDFCCVATRYFGGVMLGAGGLVRAYARCSTAALEASGIGVMREIVLCAATIPYSLYEVVKRLLLSCSAVISTEDFGAEVVLKFTLPAEDFPALQKSLAESTAGSVQIDVEALQMGLLR